MSTIVEVWTGPEPISEDAQLYSARHTLCGELSQPETENHIETKFHVFSELGMSISFFFWYQMIQLGYIIMTTLFSAAWMGSITKFSLSLVADRKFLQRYLLLHSIIEDSKFAYHVVPNLLFRNVSFSWKIEGFTQ